jgi:hypothetical protein
MKPIAFSGMMCSPINITKDGEFRIKGVINHAKDHPEIVRYENFASTEERDKRFNMIVNLLKEER